MRAILTINYTFDNITDEDILAIVTRAELQTIQNHGRDLWAQFLTETETAGYRSRPHHGILGRSYFELTMGPKAPDTDAINWGFSLEES